MNEKNTSIRKAVYLLCAASLTACASFTGIEPVSKSVTAEDLKLAAAPLSPTEISNRWWESFGDAQLNSLVEQALANNPSLRMAQARTEKALATSGVVQSADGLHVEGQLDAQRQRFSANSLYPPPFGGSIYEMGTLQLNASWELDFFGKNRSALEAALGQVNAAKADAQAARLLLAGNVARTYFQIARIEAQLNIAQRVLQQRAETRQLVKDRLAAGLDTQLEFKQSEAAIPDAQLQIENLVEQKQLALHALAALLAKPNEELVINIADLQTIKTAVSTPNVPADLLGRRPDIAAAKARVNASARDVDSAKALFYPNVNLVAFAGYSSIGLDKLLDAPSQQWGVGPAIRLPIFEAGRLKANLKGKTSDLDAAVESYNSTVIDAVRDAADQISTARSISNQQAQQAQALASVEATYAIAQQRFDAGLGTKLNVLAAESPLLAQRRLAIDLKAREIDTQVQLMRALGGGFHDEQTVTSAR